MCGSMIRYMCGFDACPAGARCTQTHAPHVIHAAPYRVVDWAGSHPIDEIEGTEWFFAGRVTCLVAKNERARRGQAGKRVRTVSNGQTEPDQGRSSPGVISLERQLWRREGSGGCGRGAAHHTGLGWRGDPPPQGGWHEPLGGRDHPP